MRPSEQLALDVLTMAVSGGMPETYWATDGRIQRACGVLGVDTTAGHELAEQTLTDERPDAGPVAQDSP